MVALNIKSHIHMLARSHELLHWAEDDNTTYA